MKPWTDRSGRLSYLKIAALVAAMTPGVWIAFMFSTGKLGPLPIDMLTNETGTWAIRFLFISLLVTPLQRIGNWPRLILVRRTFGLTALSYAGAHFAIYTIDQNYELARVASEIVQRFYLAVGFTTLLGLLVLGATSTDGIIRRMGHRWKQLHRIVYGIAVLGIVHFFLQAKIDATEPTLMAGFFILLIVYRVAILKRLRLSPALLTLIAVGAAAATAGFEYAWYALATGVDPKAVFLANFAFPQVMRPALVVLAAGLALAMLSATHHIRNRLKQWWSSLVSGKPQRAALASRH